MKEMTKGSRIRFLFCFYGAMIALLAAILETIMDGSRIAEWIGTSGILFGLAGAFHLEVSGFLSWIEREFADSKVYPYGPPSPYTREIIDTENPGKGILHRAHGKIFNKRRLGYWLVVLGASFGIPALWL